MDTFEAIMSRRTSHLWKDEPVPEEVLSRALEGAHHAPCHRFTWPWRFIRVSEPHREALFALALELKSKGREQTPAFLEKIRKKVRNPAELVVVVQPRKEDAFEAREDYAAIACAIQNMALIVHAAGYASKWSTGELTTHADTYGMLAVDEREQEIVGFVWIGVPELENPPIPKRSPLEEHVRWSSEASWTRG